MKTIIKIYALCSLSVLLLSCESTPNMKDWTEFTEDQFKSYLPYEEGDTIRFLSTDNSVDKIYVVNRMNYSYNMNIVDCYWAKCKDGEVALSAAFLYNTIDTTSEMTIRFNLFDRKFLKFIVTIINSTGNYSAVYGQDGHNPNTSYATYEDDLKKTYITEECWNCDEGYSFEAEIKPNIGVSRLVFDGVEYRVK